MSLWWQLAYMIGLKPRDSGELEVDSGYSLLLDQGCFHAIPGARRDASAAGVTAAAADGATLLLFGFAPGAMRRGPRG